MILKAENVTKSFGGINALESCSLEIKKGKITAIIGPNGSGKSTLFNAISQLIQVDKGKILFNNQNITNLPAHHIAKLGISRTFQEVRLFKNLTIQDHLSIALLTTDENLLKNFFQKQENLERIKDVLQLVGLDKPLNTYASNLSYGQRKLLDLAIAITKPHSLLMLDEPVSGVNPRLRKEIKAIIKNLNKQGETIILIEHDMNFVMDLAEHIFVLDAGKVIAQGNPTHIQNNKKVLEAYLGD